MVIKRVKPEIVRPQRRKMNNGYKRHIVSSGISMGSALAIVLSYAQNNSVLWAIVHGLFSWVYVIYFVIVYRILG